MTPLSIGKAWQDTVIFVRREGHLLFPVALLFLALPMAIWPHLIPAEWDSWKPDGAGALPPVPVSMWLGFILAMLISTFGALALFSLALRPGISVGEALRLGLARLPVLIGAALLIIGGFVLVALIGLALAGMLAVASRATGTLAAVLLSIAVMAFFIYVSARLSLLNPVVLDRQDGPVGSLRRAWALSHGHVWRLLGFLLLIMLVTTIASGAAQAVFGTIGGLVGGAASALLLGGLASAIVSAGANVYILVMLARIYLQLQPRDLGEIFR